MNKSINNLHFWVGIATWAIVFGLSFKQLANSDLLALSVVLQVLILACLTMTNWESFEDSFPVLARLALWLMLPLALALAWFVRIDYFFIYTIVWISIAVYYHSRRVCWLMLFVIGLAWYVIRAFSWQHDSALLEVLLVGSFHLFALVSSQTAKKAALANEQTQQLNRDLLATQHLLGAASKENERTRIARDLHDLLGHHLTALSIQLQVASRISEGEVKDKLEQCHALSKLLLSDVRDAVTTIRATPSVDIRELLSLAIRDIPQLSISLAIEEQVQVNDVEVAQVILRSVQEAITNSLRHSNAKSMEIEVSAIGDQIKLHIRDDGRGAANLVAGNGLQGMQERVDQLRGKLTIQAQPSMTIEMTLPQQTAASI